MVVVLGGRGSGMGMLRGIDRGGSLGLIMIDG